MPSRKLYVTHRDAFPQDCDWMFDYMVLLISFVIAEVVVVSADHVGDVADCVVDDDDCVIANGVV